ncbi:YlqD family protein [Alkalibacillus aidingensis]|uniref:YlqD family protein n=1 Tax=Alkalibacillus aidingensis TaxID=2747607 RepID=UPI001660E9A1|nr:YlqD family protein [Alkalibacillus aidingensis]
MQFIRKTTIKQVVTESSKQQLLDKFQKLLNNKKKEIQQLQFEKRKLIYQRTFDQAKVEEKFAKEELKRQQSIDWYEQQISQLEQLPLGSEIIEGEVEEIVEKSIGDPWEDVVGEKAVVIQDGQIVRIDR